MNQDGKDKDDENEPGNDQELNLRRPKNISSVRLQTHRRNKNGQR